MKINLENTLKIAKKIGIDWNKVQFTPESLLEGIKVETEHGKNIEGNIEITNITNNDPILTTLIAYRHLLEFPDYYKRLSTMENEAKEFWKTQRKDVK